MALSVQLQVTAKHDLKGLTNKQPVPFYLSGCFSSVCWLMGMLVPHGGEVAAVVPGITLRNDNIQWKKGECPSLMGHLLLRAKKPFPEAVQQTFLMGQRLLPKPIPSMMEGITRIGSSNNNSLGFCFSQSCWRGVGPSIKVGHSGNEERGMATGQAFSAVTLGNCF